MQKCFVDKCFYFPLYVSIESPANTSIPQSLSKPVHFHRVACQNTSLTLHECSYTRYSDDINNITDVIVYCKERKLYSVAVLCLKIVKMVVS